MTLLSTRLEFIVTGVCAVKHVMFRFEFVKYMYPFGPRVVVGGSSLLPIAAMMEISSHPPCTPEI